MRLKMREILYRGKPKNKEHSYFFSEIWKKHYEKGFVYGSLIVYKDRCFIAVSAQCDIKHCVNNGLVSMIEVAPETVGQFTGLTDKNGKKIFEGDIIKYKNTDGIKFNGVALTVIGKVVYNEKNASFAISGKDEIGAKHYDYFPIKNIEIIGNIHDNPELRKGGVDNG